MKTYNAPRPYLRPKGSEKYRHMAVYPPPEEAARIEQAARLHNLSLSRFLVVAALAAIDNGLPLIPAE